jgi:hypothetical protein
MKRIESPVITVLLVVLPLNAKILEIQFVSIIIVTDSVKLIPL